MVWGIERLRLEVHPERTCSTTIPFSESVARRREDMRRGACARLIRRAPATMKCSWPLAMDMIPTSSASTLSSALHNCNLRGFEEPLQLCSIMATSCGPAFTGTTKVDSRLVSFFVARTTGFSSSSCGVHNGAFKAVEMRGVSTPLRKALQVFAMASPKPGKAKKGIGVNHEVVGLWVFGTLNAANCGELGYEWLGFLSLSWVNSAIFRFRVCCWRLMELNDVEDRSGWACEAGIRGWKGYPCATCRSSSRVERSQHYGFLQGVQCKDRRQAWLYYSRWDHSLWCTRFIILLDFSWIF